MFGPILRDKAVRNRLLAGVVEIDDQPERRTSQLDPIVRDLGLALGDRLVASFSKRLMLPKVSGHARKLIGVVLPTRR
jgi:hypothetical protein